MKQYLIGAIGLISLSYFSYSFFQKKDFDFQILSKSKKEKIKKRKSQKLFKKQNAVFIRPPSVQATDMPKKKYSSNKKKLKKTKKTYPKTSSKVKKSVAITKGVSVKDAKDEKHNDKIASIKPKKNKRQKRAPSSASSSSAKTLTPAGAPASIPAQEADLYWYKKIVKDPSLKSVTEFVSAYKTRQIEHIDFSEVVSQLILHPSYFVRKAALMISSQIISSDSFMYLTQIKYTDQSLEKEVNFHLQKYLLIEHLDFLKSTFTKSNDHVILKEAITYVISSAKNNLGLKQADHIIFSDTYSPFIDLIKKVKNIFASNEQKVFYEKSLGELNKLLSY